jgi:hypothetical protein
VADAPLVAQQRALTCKACGGPLQSRDGIFVLKYFLVEAGKRNRRAKPLYK